MSDSTIRSLPIWQGRVHIEPLAGGITNLNYRVVDGDRQYAVRTGQDDPALGISRRNELACTTAAADLGIAPRVAYSAPGVMVSDFIESTPLTPELIRQPERLARIVSAIRAIHAAGVEMIGHLRYFCPFQVARTYLAFAAERGLTLPGDGGADLCAEVRELHGRIGPFEPTFCHNDMMPGNFLDTGDRLWTIDWEYSGIGNPLFDLAGLASNCDFDSELDGALLQHYFGASGPPAGIVPQFRVMKAMAALRESLWAVVQASQTTIQFDYDGYRDDNYLKYCRFRSQVFEAGG